MEWGLRCSVEAGSSQDFGLSCAGVSGVFPPSNFEKIPLMAPVRLVRSAAILALIATEIISATATRRVLLGPSFSATAAVPVISRCRFSPPGTCLTARQRFTGFRTISISGPVFPSRLRIRLPKSSRPAASSGRGMFSPHEVPRFSTFSANCSPAPPKTQASYGSLFVRRKAPSPIFSAFLPSTTGFRSWRTITV